MTEIETLIAIEQIKQLKSRYFRAYDTKDYGWFATLFTPNARFDMSQAASAPHGPAPSPESKNMVFIGRANIEAFVRSAIPSWSAHHGHNPDIELKSATTATGIWALADEVAFLDGGPFKTLRGFGHYHDTYERIDGQWLIASTEIRRLHLEIS